MVGSLPWMWWDPSLPRRATAPCAPVLRRCALPPGEWAGLASSVRIMGRAPRTRHVPNDSPRVRPKEAAMVRRWVPALVLGAVWWWAVLRLVLDPAHAGPVEGAVAAGGWGLSLLPVHVAETARPTGIFDAGTGLLRRCVGGVREAGRTWWSLISGSPISGSSVPGSSIPGSSMPSSSLSGSWKPGEWMSGSWMSGSWWREAGRSWSLGTGGLGRAWRATRAWRRRRSGGGSGRS